MPARGAAVADYVAEAGNIAAQSKQLFKNMFEGAEDALVSFVTTGKADFKSLADSIIADLIRIQIRAMLAQSLTALFGGVGEGSSGGGWLSTAAKAVGGLFGGGKAEGGPVDAGRSYLVGERGPEMIVPRMPGFVVPNHKLGGLGGGPTVNIHTTINAAAGTNVAQLGALLDERDAKIKHDVFENLSRGRWAGAIG